MTGRIEPGTGMDQVLTGVTCWCGGRVVLGDEGTGWYCKESPEHEWAADGRPKTVRKLYVSGPMTGYPECNYPAFRAAARQLREAGYEPADPSTVSNEGHYTDILRRDLRLLMECDGVALLGTWWESTGARLEIQIAGVLRMPVHTVREWLTLAYEGVPRHALLNAGEQPLGRLMDQQDLGQEPNTRSGEPGV